MILAAADCADGTGSPPVELEYVWNAKRYGGLPEPGGQLDQPAGLLRRMRAVENTYEAWTAYKNQPAKDVGMFIKNHKEAWMIVKSILDMRRDG